ncbi:MAG: MATE family efflux transporter, partial [Limnochordia bacterium]|nr:MATE family efflux transporter [Limnochordia bacterium]
MKVLDFSDQRYWRLILATGIPIMVQNLIFNSFTLVDNILVGGLGEVNIAAVGVANKFTFIFMLFLFGINSGTNIFSAQYWGKRDLEGVRRVLGLSLGLGLMVSIPFTLTALLAPHIIIDIFSNDPEVIRLGAQYLTIVGLTFPINAIASSFSMQSRGVGRAKVPLVASSVGFLLNAFLDYALIYGKFGFPQMGIQGAALATLVSKVLECLVLLGIIYYNKYELAARFSEFNGYSREFLLRFFRPVLPVILNEMFWAVGVSFYTYFYGILGT